MNRHFKKIDSNDHVLAWESKGLSNRINKPPFIINRVITSKLSYLGTKVRVKSDGSCLKQDKIRYTHGKIVNIYIV